MRALVTGAAGFIGSHLAEALCRRGVEVAGVDNFSFGSRENLAWKRSGDAFELHEGDICDGALMRELAQGCDWVFHHAAMASVPQSVMEPEKSNRENLDAVLGLLCASREAGVKRFVFASSCSIYGTSTRPLVEADPPNPASPYALQKYAAEQYVRLFHALHGMEGVALRYFNVYGPRQSGASPYSGVLARFCETVLAGGQPEVFGDGQQSRDFVNVRDVVRANLLAAERPDAGGKVFNIGSGRSPSLLEVIAVLGRLAGRELTPRFAPERPGDVRFSAGDISEARRGLGFEPQVSLEEGLRETLEFFRQRAAAKTGA